MSIVVVKEYCILTDASCFLIDFSAMGCLWCLLVSEKNNELFALQTTIYLLTIVQIVHNYRIMFISRHTHLLFFQFFHFTHRKYVETIIEDTLFPFRFSIYPCST